MTFVTLTMEQYLACLRHATGDRRMDMKRWAYAAMYGGLGNNPQIIMPLYLVEGMPCGTTMEPSSSS